MVAQAESELIARASRGDLEAFTAIIRVRQTSIRAFCARLLSDRDQADDVAQEVLVASFTSLSRFDPSKDFDAWLWGIARHKVRDALRSDVARLGAWGNALSRDLEQRCERETSDDAVLEALRSCVASLKDTARTVIEGVYRDERPAKDLAHELGISEGSLYTTLTRIRQGLRRCVGERLGQQWA